MDQAVRIIDVVNILAIIAGPILAIQIQVLLDRRREARVRRLQIFRNLMATRALTLSPTHVEALNMISLEFHGSSSLDLAVVAEWKKYLDHLGNCPQDQKSADYQAQFTLWCDKNGSYLVSLLSAMSKALGFNFDEIEIKKGIYHPQGHSNVELEQNFIRTSLVDMWLGRKEIPIRILGQSDRP